MTESTRPTVDMLHWDKRQAVMAIKRNGSNKPKNIASFNSKMQKWRDEHPGELFDLKGVDIFGADLSGLNFSFCDFAMANLKATKCKLGTDIPMTTFEYSNLSMTDLTHADLLKASFKNAKYDHGTRMPTGYNPVKLSMVLDTASCAAEPLDLAQLTTVVDTRYEHSAETPAKMHVKGVRSDMPSNQLEPFSVNAGLGIDTAPKR